MTHELYKGALNDACLKLAKTVLWTPDGVSSDVVETMAAKFQEIAVFYAEYLIGQDRDPNMLTRAVTYLTQAHAIPPMRSDTRWFQDMLGCLIELAVPNTGLEPDGAAFLTDLKLGVEESIASANE